VAPLFSSILAGFGEPKPNDEEVKSSARDDDLGEGVLLCSRKPAL
jgi:hypothetical protein